MTETTPNEGLSGGSTYDPSIYEHPLVRELLNKIDELTANMGDFDIKIKDYEAKKKVVTGNRAKFLESIQAQLKEFDTEIYSLDQAKYEIEKGLRESKALKSQLHEELDDLAKQVVADDLLKDAREKWAQIKSEHDWLWIENIRDYQETCIEFTASGLNADHFGKGIFDEPGLGKTLEAAAAIDLIQADETAFDNIIKARMPDEKYNSGEVIFHNVADSPCRNAVLWVCPNGIKSATAREIGKWSKRLVVILEGNPTTRKVLTQMAYDNGLTLICSYEQLRDRNGKPTTPELMTNHWPIVVMDEAHYFKNTDRGTFKNMREICNGSAYIIPMTGTPIMNRPDELFAILHMLTLKGTKAGKFAKHSYFANDYLYWDGSANVDRLMKAIGDMCIRRTKQEVLKDLPDKLRFIRFVELYPEEREPYDEVREKLILWIDEHEGEFINIQNFLAQITYLRQLCLLASGVKMKDSVNPETGAITAGKHFSCVDEDGHNISAKIDDAMALTTELLDADEKVVIYTNFTGPVQEVQERVTRMNRDWTHPVTGEVSPIDCAAIYGPVPERERDTIQQRFMDPDSNLRVLVCNIRAGGVGLNLQGACSNLIFLDLDWSPGRNEQAEGRLHRLGQTKDVMVHIIQAEDTVDAFIALKLENKTAMITGTIERAELRKALEDGLI